MIQHILGVCIIYTLHVYSYDTLVSFALVLFWGLEASLPFASAAGRVTWSNYHGGSATPQKGNHPNPKGLTRLWTTNKHLWYLEVSINGGTYRYPKIDVFFKWMIWGTTIWGTSICATIGLLLEGSPFGVHKFPRNCIPPTDRTPGLLKSLICIGQGEKQEVVNRYYSNLLQSSEIFNMLYLNLRIFICYVWLASKLSWWFGRALGTPQGRSRLPLNIVTHICFASASVPRGWDVSDVADLSVYKWLDPKMIGRAIWMLDVWPPFCINHLEWWTL